MKITFKKCNFQSNTFFVKILGTQLVNFYSIILLFFIFWYDILFDKLVISYGKTVNYRLVKKSVTADPLKLVYDPINVPASASK